MDPNATAIRIVTALQRIIIGVAILFGASCSIMLTSCRSRSHPILSKSPVVQPNDSQSGVAVYIEEFRRRAENYYWVPISPDQKRELYIERENPSTWPGGFFSLRLRDKDSGNYRILFTLWDADVDSGVRAHCRWSRDGKALQITGDTRGFSYEPAPDATKDEPFYFNFIYLAEQDKFYSLPTEGI